MADLLTLEDFLPYVRTRFAVGGAEGCELELRDATDHSNGRLEQFSLLFSGPASPFLPQQVHRLKHSSMGEIEIFLVPLGPEAGAMRYEAVFSRFTESR